MDKRGIEVTNQLRSAIRAKLLELGVRYDEELPDYILVMVANKKSRQQMHEDLYLFLESCTTPFVDWLHDQVLKKLQKVTVAKKKSLREFVPTVVVKQEEERKKRKITTTSFLEDQTGEKSSNKNNVKDDKSFHKQIIKPSTSSQKIDTSQNKNLDKSIKSVTRDNKPDNGSNHIVSVSTVVKRIQHDGQSGNTVKEVITPEISNLKSEDVQATPKLNDGMAKSVKRPFDASNSYRDSLEKKQIEAKRSKLEEELGNTDEDNTKKVKSCVNKPKVTSVVSVKTRLGIVSSRKKFESHREMIDNASRYRLIDSRFEKNRFDTNRNTNFQRGRTFAGDERLRRKREMDLKHGEQNKVNDIKNRLSNSKAEKTSKSTELKEKCDSNLKQKLTEKSIKDRLGIVNANRPQKQSAAVKCDVSEDLKILKSLEQDRASATNNTNIKNRLGPLRQNFKSLNIKSGFNKNIRHSQSSEDDDCLNLGAEEELDDETQLIKTSGPIKSHIIAVNRPSVRIERKRLKPLEKISKDVSTDPEEDIDEIKIPSKVIVTPRPLKPLQPTQKRATQSLLLRAVAEANQSVVTQKNPEPSLLEKKLISNHHKPIATREVGQNLSVHFNSNKRLVMEKIQVELSTSHVLEREEKPYVPQPVTDEHMGVVMSLFQKSDDNQKFLVTLNGYNNNLTKDKTVSDDDERLEMEVNEDDELALLTTQTDTYVQSQSEQNVFRITDTEDDIDVIVKDRSEENNENCNTENVEHIEEVPRKRRKLSPIVYNRSQSPSPVELKSTTITNSILNKRVDKKPLTENTVTVVDKSREKCRYWPNCTLGNKCAYLHPPVMCSLFPGCKFGDKCAYRHPKCKFGLSCTKLGCMFSHPAQQCKYHPYCNKPACPFSHSMPQTLPTITAESSSQRAKFTWRRRD